MNRGVVREPVAIRIMVVDTVAGRQQMKLADRNR